MNIVVIVSGALEFHGGCERARARMGRCPEATVSFMSQICCHCDALHKTRSRVALSHQRGLSHVTHYDKICD